MKFKTLTMIALSIPAIASAVVYADATDTATASPAPTTPNVVVITGAMATQTATVSPLKTAIAPTATAVAAPALPATGKRIYISPKGLDRGTGLSPATALSFGQLNKAVTLAGPGGTVILIADAGAYATNNPVVLQAGGTIDKPVTIIGAAGDGRAMAAQFTGSRAPIYTAKMAAGNEIFRLMPGADNVVFKSLGFKNVGTVFRIGGSISNLSLDRMEAGNVQRFFEDYASGSNTSATISGLSLSNISVTGFSKGVVRLQYDTNKVTMTNLQGDSMRQDGDNFAIGVHLDGTVHDVAILNSRMGNVADSTNAYWNGDGFASERGVYRVTYTDCQAWGNTDAGFDLKSTETRLIRPMAIDNAHNYRLWGQADLEDAVGLDAHYRGGTGSQIQLEIVKGATVTATRLVLADSGSKTLMMRIDGALTLTAPRLMLASTAKLYDSASGRTFTWPAPARVPASGLFSTNGNVLWSK